MKKDDMASLSASSQHVISELLNIYQNAINKLLVFYCSTGLDLRSLLIPQYRFFYISIAIFGTYNTDKQVWNMCSKNIIF